MGIYINGVKQGKPYINAVKYNGYINGQKILMVSYPPDAILADSSGYVDIGSNLCRTGYYCNAEYGIFTSSGTVITYDYISYDGDFDFPIIKIYAGVGGYGLFFICDCSFD